VFLLAGAAVAADGSAASLRVIWSREDAPREDALLLRWNTRISNPGAATVSNVVVRAFAPLAAAPGFLCLRLEASSPAELLTDDCGNRLLVFRLGDLPPYATRGLSFSAALAVTNGALPDARLPALADAGLDEEDPGIRAAAARFPAGPPRERAERIAAWVAGALRYDGYHGGDRGAAFALRERRGDCTESAALFASLCRAGGIAARRVLGFRCDGSQVLEGRAAHMWAEFHADGAWHVADPRPASASVAKGILVGFVRRSGHSPFAGLTDFQLVSVSDPRIKVEM
jgi:transglutaminase-like putative cysteine protease